MLEYNNPVKKVFTISAVLANYLQLIRFRYHITFVSVIFGALLITKQFTGSLVKSLLILYVSFNVLLYGGIYTINAIADLKSDREHPLKRRRPLPAREIGMRSAMGFSLVLISSGLLTGFLLFNIFVFYVYLAFLAVNAFYSLVSKDIAYFELVVNAATHPLRFMMGVFLVDGEVPQPLLSAIFFLAFGLVTVRRCIEKDVKGWEARKVLKVYSNRMLLGLRLLAFFAILLILIVDTSTPDVFYWSMLTVYLVLVFGVDFWAPVRRVFVWLWTR